MNRTITQKQVGRARALKVMREGAESARRNAPAVGAVIVLSAPYGFSKVYNLIKRWLAPTTAKKIHILGCARGLKQFLTAISIGCSIFEWTFAQVRLS